MTNSEVLKFLVEHQACEDAVEWVRKHGGDLAALWAECEQVGWMLWMLRRLPEADAVQRWFATRCARRVLKFYEKQHPDDNRPRRAIEVAERYAHGKVTEKELVAARDAARGAARGAATGAAWAAAWGAAWAAAGGAARGAAGDAARDAAWDAARGAAKDAAGGAAGGAARDAAWGAAWGAERTWQRACLRELVMVLSLEGEGDE
jgi:hypothetical protein